MEAPTFARASAHKPRPLESWTPTGKTLNADLWFIPPPTHNVTWLACPCTCSLMFEYVRINEYDPAIMALLEKYQTPKDAFERLLERE